MSAQLSGWSKEDDGVGDSVPPFREIFGSDSEFAQGGKVGEKDVSRAYLLSR